MGIFVDVCVPKTDHCFTTTVPMTIVPTSVDRVDFRFPDKYLITGVPIPFAIKAFDSYGNEVTSTLANRNLTTTNGMIDGVKIREFSSFDEIFLYEDALPKETMDELVTFTLTDPLNPAKKFTYQTPLYRPIITTIYSAQTYKLPNTLDAVMSGGYIVQT
jgi:hypothetical protein